MRPLPGPQHWGNLRAIARGSFLLILLAVFFISLTAISFRAPAQPQPLQTVVGKQADGSYLMSTGQVVTPAGVNTPFAGRASDFALSPDGSTLAVITTGGIRLFDFPSMRQRGEAIKGSYAFRGLAWSADGSELYVAGSVSRPAGRGKTLPVGAVEVLRMDSAGRVAALKPMLFPLAQRIRPKKDPRVVTGNWQSPESSNPSGLALSPDNRTLYVSLFNNSTVAAVDLATYDPHSGSARYAEAPVGSSPEAIALVPALNKIYVADRGGRAPQTGDTLDHEDPVVVDPETDKANTGCVSVLDVSRMKTNPRRAAVKTIPVGLQSAAMALSPEGTRLYAANANSDTVSVIDTRTDSVVETIPTSPAPGGLGASSPNSLAISPDGRILYVGLGGDNAVEELALDGAAGGTETRTRIAGLIPTAWFPLNLILSPNGTQLTVLNCKGIGSLGNLDSYRQRGYGKVKPQQGPGGTLGPKEIDYPAHSVFAVMGSVEVIPMPDAPSLARYTEQVAENNHFDSMARALAAPPGSFWSRFKHVVLIINENRAYDQVFGDVPVPPGHPGGDEHLVMFGERITPNKHALAREFGLFDNLYCSGQISADGHHWLNEAFADDYDERGMDAYPRSYPCCGLDPLSFAGNKFVWQAALDHGLTFRDYGEYPVLPSMERHGKEFEVPFKVSANLNIDSMRGERIGLDVKRAERDGSLPRLTFVWLDNDHTSGLEPDAYTPESDVADNDLGVGRIVDAITHSDRYWRREPTAIFVVEDDAQGGLDHVDGHRTVGLVLSPFNRRHQVFSGMYNQVSMVRTMELMLGIGPLNQFDAAADPMREVFQTEGDFRSYTVESNRIALDLRNPPVKKTAGDARRWAIVSSRLDFSAPDRADPDTLTEILWHHTHGSEPYPPTDASRD